jgi:hypothetical protein
MAHPYNHAISSAKKFGGKPEDYQAIHDFFDSSKAHYAHWRHRAVLHNSFGIYLAERIFGTTITNSDGKKVPVRLVGEQHVLEDLGIIPTVADWMRAIGDPTQQKPWMTRGVDKRVTVLEEIVKTDEPFELKPVPSEGVTNV